MNKKTLIYYIQFYFWAVLFFIEGLYFLIKKPKPTAQPSTEVNLLDDEEAKLAKKPSSAEAMANKARLGIAYLPKKDRKKIIIGIMLMVFFLLFGIANFIYWNTVIIKKYNIVGWVLLSGILTYLFYLFFISAHSYLKNKKYMPFIFTIQVTWYNAKNKSGMKLI